MKSHAKFMLLKDEKKSLTKYKQNRLDLIENLQENDVLIRKETLKGSVVRLEVRLCKYSLYDYIRKNDKSSIHEVIVNENIRLCFDIDDCPNLNTCINSIYVIIKKYCNVTPTLITLSSTGKKEKYRIYTNISCNI